MNWEKSESEWTEREGTILETISWGLVWCANRGQKTWTIRLHLSLSISVYSLIHLLNSSSHPCDARTLTLPFSPFRLLRERNHLPLSVSSSAPGLNPVSPPPTPVAGSVGWWQMGQGGRSGWSGFLALAPGAEDLMSPDTVSSIRPRKPHSSNARGSGSREGFHLENPKQAWPFLFLLVYAQAQLTRFFFATCVNGSLESSLIVLYRYSSSSHLLYVIFCLVLTNCT